jgi:hypothetical protein
MTFPTGTVISTTNVSTADSNPSLARTDIYDLIVAFNQLVASVNTASGVAALNGDGTLSSQYLPTTYATSGDLQLRPSSKIVNIRDVLRMAQRLTADNSLLTGSVAGDIIYLTDGDRGLPCLAVYDGTNWRIVRLATIVGSAGAALTATSTLSATAVA